MWRCKATAIRRISRRGSAANICYECPVSVRLPDISVPCIAESATKRRSRRKTPSGNGLFRARGGGVITGARYVFPIINFIRFPCCWVICRASVQWGRPAQAWWLCETGRSRGQARRYVRSDPHQAQTVRLAVAGLRPVRQDICRRLRAHAALRQILWRARAVLPVVAGPFAQSFRGCERGLAAPAPSDIDDQLALGGVIPDQRIGLAGASPPGRDTYVGYHRDLRRLARLRALLDLVVERLAG